MDASELIRTAYKLVAPGKGILAADESTGTIKKRFDAVGVENSESNRQAYRQLLFGAPGIEQSISGVILYDETIRQASSSGTPFPKLLAGRGILPGIKVDKGAVDLAGHAGEKITEGLDGLRARLEEYRSLGAVFAKWRAVITIGDGIPSWHCLKANAAALARYAALCQEAGLAPIVEPEVLMDGSHSIEHCAQATEAALRAVFSALAEAGVLLEGMLLKPNMVIAGENAPAQASPEQVARATVDVLRRTVPPAVPGIVFLSGGQSPRQATLHLNEMNRMGPHPWRLSFSYGRALQDEALKAWRGQPANVAEGQKAFQQRAAWAGAACRGAYQASAEPA